MFRQIKWAWQRAIRGYDDSIYWGFDGYFADVIVPPLKKFCEEQLADKEFVRLNEREAEVYKETLKRIEALENESFEDMFNDVAITNLVTYFGQNIGCYWD